MVIDRFLRRAILLILALAAASSAWADLAGQAGPYGIRVQMRPEVPVIGDNQARISVTDKSAQPVKGARVSVTVEMLDMDMGSQTTAASEESPGTYTAAVSLSMGGRWRLKVVVDGASGKGEAAFKIATGVSTAVDAAGARTQKGVLLGLLALAVIAAILILRARRRAAARGVGISEPHVSAAAGVSRERSPAVLWLRRHYWGVLVILLAWGGATWAVKRYKKPGQMNVIEAQAMDMSGLKAPVGATPVATETVGEGFFESAVTVTGSVAAETDEDIYPRVVGRIVWMPFYPGDGVSAGQVVARLDDTELRSKVDEARADRAMKQFESAMARAGVRQAESQRGEAEARAFKARGGLRDAESGVAAAQGALQQARSDAVAARSDLSEAQSQQTAASQDREQAQAALEGARASLSEAEAGVATAQANLAYWQEEIKREDALIKSGAISQEEYDRERAQFLAAQAAVRQAQERARSMQSGVRAAEARIRQADAMIAAAQARADKTRANIAAAQARVDQAQAAVQSAFARVAQSQAEVREADAAVRTAAETTQVALEGAGRGAAGEQQAAAGERTASIVHGYTEIRAVGGGRVVQRLVSPGVLVSPGTPILKIARIDRVRLQANVAQSDVDDIRAGGAVWVTSQKNPGRRVLTRVTTIFPSADPTSRTAVVEALTPNPGFFFLPGEFVTMKIATGQQERALTVPTEAIVEFEGRPAVWRAVDGKARRVPITVGRTDGERTQVLAGMKPGDLVITRGHTYLKPGDAVFPTRWNAEGPPDIALRRQGASTESRGGMSGGGRSGPQGSVSPRAGSREEKAAPPIPQRSGPPAGGEHAGHSMPGTGQ